MEGFLFHHYIMTLRRDVIHVYLMLFCRMSLHANFKQVLSEFPALASFLISHSRLRPRFGTGVSLRLS